MQPSGKIKVLMVEDDEAIGRMYDIALTQEGFLIEVSHDGTIVFETIRTNQPDIILMDVMMPNFNGLETLKELKEHPETSRIPVIMFSAYGDEAIIQTAMQYGAARYLLKHEYEPMQVAKIIQEVMDERLKPKPGK